MPAPALLDAPAPVAPGLFETPAAPAPSQASRQTIATAPNKPVRPIPTASELLAKVLKGEAEWPASLVDYRPMIEAAAVKTFPVRQQPWRTHEYKKIRIGEDQYKTVPVESGFRDQDPNALIIAAAQECLFALYMYRERKKAEDLQSCDWWQTQGRNALSRLRSWGVQEMEEIAAAVRLIAAFEKGATEHVNPPVPKREAKP